jgi:hypothetical protein
MTDVALAGGRSAVDVAGLLRSVPGTRDRGAYLRGVFSRMRGLLAASPTALRLVVHALYLMALDGEVPSKDAENAMRAFDDDVELARGGAFGDLEEIRKQVLRFLNHAGAQVAG